MAKGKKKHREKEAKTAPQKGFAYASTVEVSDEVIRRLERDLKRGTFKALTPYTLAQAYNIRMSTAKKALRLLAEKNLLVLFSGGRMPIYIKPEEK